MIFWRKRKWGQWVKRLTMKCSLKLKPVLSKMYNTGHKQPFESPCKKKERKKNRTKRSSNQLVICNVLKE